MAEQDHHKALDDIRDRLRADLKPVRPLQSERLCLGAMSVFILVAFALLLALFGLRPDRDELGTFLLWGPSVLQVMLAMIALGLAMRESFPGRSSSSSVLWAAAGAGLACHIATTFGVSKQIVANVPEATRLAVDLRGFGLELCLGVPMVLIAFWIAQRGFTARTSRLGLMIGLGAAFAADALWRMFCSITDPAHVFVSHTLAIAVIAIVGWCLAEWWRRRMLMRRAALGNQAPS